MARNKRDSRKNCVSKRKINGHLGPLPRASLYSLLASNFHSFLTYLFYAKVPWKEFLIISPPKQITLKQEPNFVTPDPCGDNIQADHSETVYNLYVPAHSGSNYTRKQRHGELSLPPKIVQ